MGASIGAVIDYLVDGLTNGKTILPPLGPQFTVPALSTINPLVEVVDTIPRTADNTWVVIGRTDWEQDQAVTGTDAYVELGAGRVEETYTIPGFVHVIQDGTAQKPVRDAVLALFDGVVRLVHADPTCGGILTRGRIAMVSGVSLIQPQATGGSVSALLQFDIPVHNTYIP